MTKLEIAGSSINSLAKCVAFISKELDEQIKRILEAAYVEAPVNNDPVAKRRYIAFTLEQVLKLRDIKKGEFARLMDVRPPVVTKWLSGEHNFTIETLFEIEQILNFTFFKYE